jgi:hypothetical protein
MIKSAISPSLLTVRCREMMTAAGWVLDEAGLWVVARRRIQQGHALNQLQTDRTV